MSDYYVAAFYFAFFFFITIKVYEGITAVIFNVDVALLFLVDDAAAGFIFSAIEIYYIAFSICVRSCACAVAETAVLICPDSSVFKGDVDFASCCISNTCEIRIRSCKSCVDKAAAAGSYPLAAAFHIAFNDQIIRICYHRGSAAAINCVQPNLSCAVRVY